VTPSIYSLFVLGAILACITTPIVRFWALKSGFVDCPNRARKVHNQEIPRLGGAAILSTYIFVLFIGGLTVPDLRNILWGENPAAGYVILGALAIFVIGVFDDLSRLSPRSKLLGEFAAIGLVVWGAELSFNHIEFLGLGTLNIPNWVGFGLACLWIVGLTNAVNLIDGLDGLASGIVILGLISISIVGYLGVTPHLHVSWLAILLIGCILGFLVYNSRPASIFLGDCGSLTLGYLAGVLALMSSFRLEGSIIGVDNLRNESTIDGIFPVLAFALPITDCVFAIARRMLRGRSPFSPDMEHFHHRLMSKGLSHGKSVLVLWGVALTSSFVAVAAADGEGDKLTAILVFFGMGGFILLRYLGYFRLEFFGEGFTSLIKSRKNTKSAEQAVKEGEDLISHMNSLEDIPKVLSTIARGIQFHAAEINFYRESGRLGVAGNPNEFTKLRTFSWQDPDQKGYFSRDKEFSVEFAINGRNFSYGSIKYIFMDGRTTLEVQDEILLERIHDAVSSLSSRLRKSPDLTE
tara:strand:+ start:17013 stop:18575 length:1563 start_codon:yes stop_codon:yes gene_type:complete